MIRVLQCEDEDIRQKFVAKLHKHLMNMKLSVDFMALFAFAGLVNDESFRKKIRILADTNIRRRRKFLERPETKGKSCKLKFTCYH